MSDNIKPVIIISAYNRPKSLDRILGFIAKANYNDFEDIKLIISIDGGGSENEKVCEIADSFEWKFGEKIIIKHKNNLGLRDHILSCGDLTQDYGNIILLEDDLIVSPNFYIFSQKALDYYKDKKEIAGISLYSYGYNENVGLPFRPAKNRSDVYFMQVPSSWGQSWTKKQWSNFKEFYGTNPEIKSSDKLPENVKKWPETSWKKYFYKYIVEKNLYFVYPISSMSSNCGDIGTHYTEKTNLLNVPLSYDDISNFIFEDLEKSQNIYDAYFERSARYFLNSFSLKSEDIVIDLYGTKQLELFDDALWLSAKKSRKKIKSYGLLTFPIEENIVRNIEGNIFLFSKKEDLDIDVNLDYKQNILNNSSVLFCSELAKLETEYRTVKKQLDLIKIESMRMRGSREWKLILKLQKIFKIFFPVGSSRRRMLVVSFRITKRTIKIIFEIKKKVAEIFFRIKNEIIKFKPKKKRKINRKSKKIVYIGHSYHHKTKSTVFLIDYLKEFFDTKVILDESWLGKPFPDLSFIDDSYLGVIFFQLLPPADILANIKNDNIIFFPMYDQSRKADLKFWDKYRNLKIINFSRTLHEKLNKWRFDSMYIQYFPEVKEFLPGNKGEAFFWQRLTCININTIISLLGRKKMKVHIHKAIDPGQEFIQPKKEDEERLEITYSEWFKTREEMWDVIRQKGIYIAPRKYEGIGLSFLEAMAMGKAVISADKPTMNEYIENGKTGYLFDLKNPKLIDLANIEEVQKNAYEFIKSGCEKWRKDKKRIIEFIKK